MAGGDPTDQLEEDGPIPLSTESTSNLTRAGSFTPQWMLSRTGAGLTHPTRGRYGNDMDRQPDSARRTRTDSIGGNQEPFASAKQPRESERVQNRTSKWVPDERDNWKSKERWATGPDKSKKWLEVQTVGRQREGWTSGDSLARGHGGDRWDTDGGRWTNERRHVEEKEYVPKNSRWNDEERGGERWRHVGSNRNPTTTTTTTNKPSSRRTTSELPLMSDLNGGLHPTTSKLKHVSKSRFSRAQLVGIYSRLLEKIGSVLPLPEGVDVSYPGFLKTDRDVKKNEEKKTEVEEEEEEFIEGISSMELEADSWVYKDPDGAVQGPFAKEEVVGWWQDGYFTAELQIQSQVSSKESWMPLRKLLAAWKIPVERNQQPTPLHTVESTGGKKLEQTSSLPTVGSYIPVSTLMEMNLESHPDTSEMENLASQSILQSVSSATPGTAGQHIPSFQNPSPDLHQSMQNLLLQRQKQSQAAAAAAGLNFGNSPMSGLRPGYNPQLQQQSALMSSYGLQQRPTGLQDNNLLSPVVLEALQQRLNAQNLSRSPMQGAGGYGYDVNSALNRNQLQGNINLAAFLQRNEQLAQAKAQQQQQQEIQQQLQQLQQRNLLPSDLQRLFQARSLTNVQPNPASALGNAPLGTSGLFGNTGRATGSLLQSPTGLQTQQNAWNIAPGGAAGGYPALNSLLQRPQSLQAQAQLLGNLQGMRFPDQLGGGIPRQPTSSPIRENLLSLSGLQSAGTVPDNIVQQRQRNSMSPSAGHAKLPFQPDPNFSLMGQNTSSTSLSNFNLQNQQPPPFPQHILQHFSPNMSETNPSTSVMVTASEILPLDQTASIPTPMSLTHSSEPLKNNIPGETTKTSSTVNAWGLPPASSQPTSFVEIQEEESKGAAAAAAQHNTSSIKERQVQAPASNLSSGSGWNVPRVKPTSFMDIMQEDAASKKQAEAQVFSQASPTIPKKGPVWSKIATTGSGVGGKAESGSAVNSFGSASTTVKVKDNTQEEADGKFEDEDEGFWNLDGTRSLSTIFDNVDGNEIVDSGNGNIGRSRGGGGNTVSKPTSIGGGGSNLFCGDLQMSVEFREWCKKSMIHLGGSGDFALIEFLMSLKSRSEIAECIQEYFGHAPSDKLSSFTTEFLKRKEVDGVQMKKEKGKKSKTKGHVKGGGGGGGDPSIRRTSVDVEASTATATTITTTATATNTSHTNPTQKTMGSSNTKTTRSRDVKPKAKKTAKGQHIPPDMLGFKSNVNHDSLYRGGSTG